MSEIILGDCTIEMQKIPENSVDEIVTDPPYGLNFMGKVWDKALPPRSAFVEMCRVLKPGALAFVMSSPRQDLMWRMAQLLEESGFELGQSFISWVYASGFPKAYDISKGIDSKKGLKQNPVKPNPFRRPNSDGELHGYSGKQSHREYDTEPVSSEAKAWLGWKSVTGLKPALEVIFMVQKPLSEKTIVDNVLKWGTGAMNVDACRIPFKSEDDKDSAFTVQGQSQQQQNGLMYSGKDQRDKKEFEPSEGRFPANILVSNDALNDGKPQNTGHVPKINSPNTSTVYGRYDYIQREEEYFKDQGSFSRYFDLDSWSQHHGFLCVPKAGTGEREYGLYLGEKCDPKSKFNLSNGSGERFDGGKLNKRRNTHPTVKPVELMAYLIELGCPRGGIVLDPFVGSGTTCVAAKKLGRKFIGIEIDEVSHRIAVARINAEPMKIDEVKK